MWIPDGFANDLSINVTKSSYGKELYQASDDGLNKWIEAADEGKMDVEG
jgi:hypothetical protein